MHFFVSYYTYVHQVQNLHLMIWLTYYTHSTQTSVCDRSTCIDAQPYCHLMSPF